MYDKDGKPPGPCPPWPLLEEPQGRRVCSNCGFHDHTMVLAPGLGVFCSWCAQWLGVTDRDALLVSGTMGPV